MAEGSFRNEMRRKGLVANCDSAGTNTRIWGEEPDARAQWVAQRNFADISGQMSRSVCRSDFTRFTLILAMDRSNIADLQDIAPPEATARICLLLDVTPRLKGVEIRDPFGGTIDDFSKAWRLIEEGTQHLAREFGAAAGF